MPRGQIDPRNVGGVPPDFSRLAAPWKTGRPPGTIGVSNPGHVPPSCEQGRRARDAVAMSDVQHPPDADFQRLIDGLRAGDESTLREVYARYGAMLRDIADSRLAPGLKRRFDADDVVQSTFRTFFRRARGGQFQFADNQRLWNLLLAIALTKLREKARYHGRQTRAVERERTQAPTKPGDSTPPEDSFIAPAPPPDASVELADAYESFLLGLDDQERKLVDLKLQDRTNDEAAEVLGISERSVRRILQRLEGKMSIALEAPT
jgi:RNA polymerase sigma-70 factor, ECF subfamily